MSDFRVAWDTNGNIARTSNFSSSPTWQSIKGSINTSETINDVTYDWQSVFIASNYQAGTQGAYCVTTQGTTLRVYFSSDVRATSVSWTLQATCTMNDSSVTTSARIAASRTVAGFVVVAWKDRTGTLVARTTDGVNWGTAVQVGSTITDTSNDNAPIGLAVDRDNQLVTAPDSSGDYFLYLATSPTGSFNKVSGSPSSTKPFPTVIVDGNGAAYTRAFTTETLDYLVTFDGSGAPYTLEAGTGAASPDINSGAAHMAADPNFVDSILYDARLKVAVDLGSALNIPAGATISYNYKIKYTGEFTSNNTGFAAYCQLASNLGYPAPGDYSFYLLANQAPYHDDHSYPNDIWQKFTYTFNHPSDPTFTNVSGFFVYIWADGLGGATAAELFIDNVRLTAPMSSTFKIASYADTATWTNITPAPSYEPAHPAALSVDNQLAMVGDLGGNQRLLVSSDDGVMWTDCGSSNYRGLQLYDKTLTLFGPGSIAYSPDFGQSIQSKNGNWSSVFGSVGTIQGVFDPDQPPICSSNSGPLTCPISFYNCGSEMSHTPVALNNGEKYEEITDLAINTPAGLLTFTRSYRQNRQDNPNFQIMGLGWTHNHNIFLTEDVPGNPNIITIGFTNGGEISFTKSSTNHFDGDPGSASYIDIDPASDYSFATGQARYTLTTSDYSIFLFDANKQLRHRQWPNGEYWEYTYSSGKLFEVIDDAYTISGSLKRKLTFTYNAASDHQLDRVTDHNGRYIQFTYARNKILSGGSIVNGTSSVLINVHDPRGKDWQYDYYGQQAGQNIAIQLNYLTRHISPSLNTDPTNTITLKNLSYWVGDGKVAKITEKFGIRGVLAPLLQTDFTFNPGLATETTGGKTILYHFKGAVLKGTELPGSGGIFAVKETSPILYRPYKETDANGNPTLLEWDSAKKGKLLKKVTDPLSQQTLFNYNSNDTLQDSTDVEGRKTEYLYTDTNNPRLPTDVKVYDTNGTTIIRWQQFTYDTRGRILTENSFDPANPPPTGAPTRQVTREYYVSGDGNGLLQKVRQHDANNLSNTVDTEYFYDNLGRVNKTKQGSTFGSCQYSYTVYDEVGNVVATVCGLQDTTPPTSVSAAIAMYDANDSVKKFNRVTTQTYDNLGRRTQTTTNAGATFAQTNLTFYDSMGRVPRTISNYSAQGTSDPTLWFWNATNGRWEYSISNTTPISFGTDNSQNIISDTIYDARGMVEIQRDALGTIIRFVYDDPGRLARTIANYVPQGSPVVDPAYWVWSTGNNRWEYATNTPVDHGVHSDQNVISDQSYDANGNLIETIDVLHNVSYTVYDALNRPVRTVRSAKDTATIALNSGDAGYDATNDPRSSSYATSTSPDRDIIIETAYDSMGRVIVAQRLLDNRPSAQKDTTLFGYDSLGRQVKVIRSASNPTYNIASDTDLHLYTESSNPDQDIISLTSYDAQGRVEEMTDVLGTKTHLVYDGFGRQVMTVGNYQSSSGDPAVWVWSSTNNRWENGSGVAISFGANNDQNVISQTTYNGDGSVYETRDVLGRVTHNVYDSVGRLTRTINNYLPQGSPASDPGGWVWSTTNNRWEISSTNITAISHGTDNDQNIIITTVYDSQGRVSQTIDIRNNAAQNVYDVLGRRVTTITNYVVQGTSDPSNWAWNTNHWEDGAGNPISYGTAKDQNRISTTTYDLVGRVVSTRDAAGIETCFTYDALGRRIQTITNYVDGVFDTAAPDEDLISTTTYNEAGQVISTTDPRGTQTGITYDKTGRRLTTIQAANSPLANTSYTCYDKAGRTLRGIAGFTSLYREANGAVVYRPTATTTPISPDTKTGTAWDFVPPHHSYNNDLNLITDFVYDLASRRMSVTNPTGDVAATAYFKDGQINSVTDPESMVTVYRYDGLRRRFRVVQGYVVQGTSNPQNWIWEAGVWKQASGGTTIVHGTNNDQNIIVDVAYDVAGRVTSQREPRGNVTTHAYDLLNRRKSLTNPSPISQTWSTAFSDLATGGTATAMTYPGVNSGGSSYTVQRNFDRLGRLSSITYGSPSTTPDVKFTYDDVGNRVKMSEYSAANFTSLNRETTYSYDDVHRVTSIGFDEDGSGTVDETVSYQYDAGGLRTQLTLPGSLNITYVYDNKGQLVGLNDWDSQHSEFLYDQVGRHAATIRANGLQSRYEYDPAGRLRQLTHHERNKVLARFLYSLDHRGNRTQAFEQLAHPASTTSTIDKNNGAVSYYQGTWIDDGSYKASTQFSARMSVTFSGNEAALTIATGSDQSIFDIYIDGSLWESFDGYATGSGERIINIYLEKSGTHTIDIRNHAEKNLSSSGYKLRFKQLAVLSTVYDQQTIKYVYDTISRLLDAQYYPGTDLSASMTRRYQYAFDRAGNHTQQIVTISGSPTTKNYTYNNTNQLTSDGTTTFIYDNNGNNITAGATWDRANRSLSVFDGANTTNYKYDGDGHRIQQGVGANVTKYLLDLQSGLAVVLSETLGANVTRHIHSPRGIHSHGDASNNWEWIMQDGLGSVRGVASNTISVMESRMYSPHGELFGVTGSNQTSFGFTGEATDSNGLLYLRARYYNPPLGVFTELDPFDGIFDRPMSLNGYSWVEGNPINRKDPSGRQSPICDIISTLYSPQLQDGDWNPNYLGGSTQIASFQNPVAFPPYPEVWGCLEEDFGMTPMNSTLISRDTLISEYRRGMNALYDAGIWYHDAGYEWVVNAFAASLQNSQLYPASVPTIIGGYIEGQSLSFTAAGNTSTFGGLEVVYNFVTFQRGVFDYAGPGVSGTVLGASGGQYVGHVENFAPQSPCDAKINKGDPYAGYRMFLAQYEGPFAYDSISGSLFGLVGLGASHFHTPVTYTSVQGVYGNTVVLSVGKGISLPIDVGYGETTYTARRSTLKSYIDPKTCGVNINQLVRDIMLGSDSPLGYDLDIVFVRSTVVAAAIANALMYNSKYADSCSCKCGQAEWG